MTSVWRTKVGDNAKAIRCLLLPASRDLTGASVMFNMRARGGASVISSAGVVVTETGAPAVEYSWAPLDLANPGEFEADFTVTYANGKSETFPEAGYIAVVIGERAV